MTVAAVASLIVGLIVGYMGQRSRMCFVGAVRDYVLIQDTGKLKGLIVFVLVAWLAFPTTALLGGVPTGNFAGLSMGSTLWLTLFGSLGVGALSTLANGCPFRQHVLAAQGAVNGLTYLAGFLVGAVLFHSLLAPWLMAMLP